jgi:hypothetical protein
MICGSESANRQLVVELNIYSREIHISNQQASARKGSRMLDPAHWRALIMKPKLHRLVKAR